MEPDRNSSLPHLLDIWRSEPTIADNIVQWQTAPARPANLTGLPADLHPALRKALERQGIFSLYIHQQQTWEAVRQGQNAVIVTETASGKTLCYNLPVVDSILRAPETRALYLFPTKALTYDQHQTLEHLLQAASELVPASRPPAAAVYDGDTPAHRRSAIRARANIILTNPDMLHTAVLPHHTLWADFFSSLRYVVIDEIHTYRGVFGSHLANLIRRLKRVLQFYGVQPQFLMTSATIANPGEHAHRLVEAPVTVIDQDGSPHGARHFIMYNPPVVDPDLGLRRSANQESIRLAGDLLDYRIQTILFGRARRSVELMLKNLQHEHSRHADDIHAYRSGYLPSERRAIESGLRRGEIQAVVATNALELGVDIGSMEAVLMVGYPGTIAAARQQSGRAGRRQGDALAVLVASSSPLDQFLMRHPEYIFDRSPEKALINPDNPLILLAHLRSAAFELAFQQGEGFGALDGRVIAEYLDFLAETGDLHFSAGRYFWMADAYPAAQISLRSTSAQPVVLHASVEDQTLTIGMVDQPSACWMVHPQAVYLHEGQSFVVENLDLENSIAHLSLQDTDYYTEAQQETTVEKISQVGQAPISEGLKNWGEILVTTRVTGYRRIRWYTHENIGAGRVDLPPTLMRTTGFWLTIGPGALETMRAFNLWHSDPNNYGPNWIVQRNRARERDHFTCQVCGAVEMGRSHHVHHKIPFRTFTSYLPANQLDNLITVCPSCHHRIETAVRMRSALSGLGYVLNNLAPLSLMCDAGDLGSFADPECALSDGQPAVVIYDSIPAGIGLSESLYHSCEELLAQALEQVASCQCREGCPSCVGPAGENGMGGKEETLALLSILNGKPVAISQKGEHGIAFG